MPGLSIARIIKESPGHLYPGNIAFVLLELDERTYKGHTRGNIGGMPRQTGATAMYGFVVIPRPAVFLGELREGNRRRILLDPASKLLEPRVFSQSVPMLTRYCGTWMSTDWVAVAVEPLLSRTVNCTSYVRASGKVVVAVTPEAV